MPFTPLHMGPGLLIKAILQGSFSLIIFGWAQIMMDLQPLFALTTGIGDLHGISHTYPAATVITILSALSGKQLTEFCLKFRGSAYKTTPVTITWPVALFSAFIGTFSHVLLDSIMHGDITPFYPFTLSNELLEFISVNQLHTFCIYSGLIGAGLYVLVRFVSRKQNQNNQSHNR